MRLLFLFLPALVLGFEWPHAPGMYPPEETNSDVGTVAPSAYMSQPEEPYMFYYEKDPSPPSGSSQTASGSEGSSPGQHPKSPSKPTPNGPVGPSSVKTDPKGTSQGSQQSRPGASPSGAPQGSNPPHSESSPSPRAYETPDDDPADIEYSSGPRGPGGRPDPNGSNGGSGPNGFNGRPDPNGSNGHPGPNGQKTTGGHGLGGNTQPGGHKGSIARPGSAPDEEPTEDGEEPLVYEKAAPAPGGSTAGGSISHSKGGSKAGNSASGANTQGNGGSNSSKYRPGASPDQGTTEDGDDPLVYEKATRADHEEPTDPKFESRDELEGDELSIGDEIAAASQKSNPEPKQFSGGPPGSKLEQGGSSSGVGPDGSEPYEKASRDQLGRKIPKGTVERVEKLEVGPNSSTWDKEEEPEGGSHRNSVHVPKPNGHWKSEQVDPEDPDSPSPTRPGSHLTDSRTGSHPVFLSGGHPTNSRTGAHPVFPSGGHQSNSRMGSQTSFPSGSEDDTDGWNPTDPVATLKPWNPDAHEVAKEVTNLVKLPVVRPSGRKDLSHGSTNNRAPWQPTVSSGGKKNCCPCCKDKQPVINGGYIETAAPSEVAGPQVVYPVRPAERVYPVPIQKESPILLNPSPVRPGGAAGYSPSYSSIPGTIPGTTGFGASYTNLPGTFYPTAPAQSPVASQYTPSSYAAPAAYAPSYGSSCGCAPPPQLCCQPVSPCCMPSLPCCPPPPPMPCCPQISLCCQPIIPCCIQLPQICLPTIPTCFRSCPACPCRRRRSVGDPRYKRAAFCQKSRVKRHSNCRQCSNWNAITQVAGGSGCGTCNGSHKRVKRLGCLPCGRKKREAEQEAAHIRQKRNCLPCLGGRKKRDASCRSCSLLQTYLTRQKRTINCYPCGRKKREAPCPCAAKAASPPPSPPRMKRAVSDYEGSNTCDRTCCDFNRCDELRAKKLDLKL